MRAAAPAPERSVLMGANIATDIARGELSEATIAFSVLGNALLLQVGGAGREGWAAGQEGAA